MLTGELRGRGGEAGSGTGARGPDEVTSRGLCAAFCEAGLGGEGDGAAETTDSARSLEDWSRTRCLHAMATRSLAAVAASRGSPAGDESLRGVVPWPPAAPGVALLDDEVAAVASLRQGGEGGRCRGRCAYGPAP